MNLMPFDPNGGSADDVTMTNGMGADRRMRSTASAPASLMIRLRNHLALKHSVVALVWFNGL